MDPTPDTPCPAAPTAAAEATASPAPPPPADLFAKHQAELLRVVVKFGDELLNIVRDTKGVRVEDVRAAVMGPLRDEARRLELLAAEPCEP